MTALAKKLMTETVEKVRAPFEEGAGGSGGAAEFRLRKLKKVEGEASCPVSAHMDFSACHLCCCCCCCCCLPACPTWGQR
jgi:hypothetical protein